MGNLRARRPKATHPPPTKEGPKKWWCKMGDLYTMVQSRKNHLKQIQEKEAKENRIWRHILQQTSFDIFQIHF